MSKTNQNPRGYWTEERAREEAMKYNTQSEFRKGNSSASSIARRKGWINTYDWFSNTKKPNGYWTEERVREEALKYKSKSEFQKGCPSAYSIAYKQGWLDTYNWFETPKPYIYWTEERVREEAMKYKTKGEFKKGSATAYGVARKNGWLDTYDWFDSPLRPKGYWTEERVCEEAMKYKSKIEFQKGCPSAHSVACKQGWLDNYDWFSNTKKPNGYWTEERVREEALKYKTIYEFIEKNNGAYVTACKYGWIDSYSWLEHQRKPNGYWTEETIRQEALKYKTRSEFREKCAGAYQVALKNGWIETYDWFDLSFSTPGFTLGILKSGDLEGMSTHQLIELIASKKVPNYFKVLVYTQPNSPERKGRISDLIAIKESAKSEEEAEAKIERIENKEEKKCEEHLNQEVKDNGIFRLVSNEGTQQLVNPDTQSNTTTENTVVLPSIALSQLRIYDNTLKMKPGDKAAEFIIKEELSKLWNSVLYANDEGKVDEEIEHIKAMELGEFASYVRDKFIEEYETVAAIEEDEDYRFDVDGDPCPPFLMQKLMAYKMATNKEFGNWCGTGAGKTNAFLFATRYIKAKVTVVILPNDVINTFVGDKEYRGAIERIYPNSNIVVPSRVEDIKTYDRNQYTYILFNYEKFQTPKTAKGFINRLLETNTIDFICLDEAHYIKVRNEDTASNRSKFINTLLIEGRKANPEMRTLFMTATPCPNCLMEIRSLIESLTGKEYPEIGNRTSVMNVHNAYKVLLLNGFRYVPKYPIVIKERTENIDCTNDSELFDSLTNNRDNDINDIELELAKRKFDVLKKELENTKDGTIVYSNWVSGMAQMLYENIKSWGYKVECYNGLSGDKEGRKDILNRFLSGKTNVLVCSQPISTGVDGLQKRCNKMVIMSLPWTDDNYKQLKGRIYRKGSNFHEVEFVIPQVFITLPNGDAWSWDALRLNAVETKRSLSSAAVDGYIQDSYRINRERLKMLALKALKAGFEEVSIERQDIETGVDLNESEEDRKIRRENYVSNVHRLGNTSNHKTMHKYFTEHPDVFNTYHNSRDTEELAKHTIIPIAKYINSHYKNKKIADLGCGVNMLSTLVENGNTVIGFDHQQYNGNKDIVVADIGNLNGIVEDREFDIVVFSLSLWGPDYEEYFNEAYRILSKNGIVFIAEPASKFGEGAKFGTKDEFINIVENYGFSRLGKVTNNEGFWIFRFEKED